MKSESELTELSSLLSIYLQTTLSFKITCWDVLPVDPDVLVPVTSGVLMVEAKRVEELVLNDAMFQTAKHRQRDHLLPPVSADVRPAPAGGDGDNLVFTDHHTPTPRHLHCLCTHPISLSICK